MHFSLFETAASAPLLAQPREERVRDHPSNCSLSWCICQLWCGLCSVTLPRPVLALHRLHLLSGDLLDGTKAQARRLGWKRLMWCLEKKKKRCNSGWFNRDCDVFSHLKTYMNSKTLSQTFTFRQMYAVKSTAHTVNEDRARSTISITCLYQLRILHSVSTFNTSFADYWRWSKTSAQSEL